MKSKLINESAEKAFAVIFEKGDEVIETLRRFANERRLLASHFTAIGALSDVVIGFFDPTNKQYKKIPIRERHYEFVRRCCTEGRVLASGTTPSRWGADA